MAEKLKNSKGFEKQENHMATSSNEEQTLITYWDDEKLLLKEELKFREENGKKIRIESKFYSSTGVSEFPYSITLYNNEGFTKNITTYYKDGQIRKFEPYWYGKLHGTVKEYDKDKKLIQTSDYKNGYVNGYVIKYNFLTNKPWSKEQIENDMRNGTSTYYFDNGQIKTKVSYKNNLKNGLEINYHQNGNLLSTVNWDKGQKDGEERHFSEQNVLEMVKEWKNGAFVKEKDLRIKNNKEQKTELKSVFEKQNKLKI